MIAIINRRQASPSPTAAEEVWPWLVQVGCLRAGWYADDWIRERAEAEHRRRTPPAVDHRRLALIRAIHTAAWASIEACVGYLVWSGIAGRSDRRSAVAAAVVAGECLVFAADGFRCPLTGMAEAAGAASGSVTDIYLPAWFARNLPAIHLPVLVLIGWLHRRAIRNGSSAVIGRAHAARDRRSWRHTTGSAMRSTGAISA